MNRLTAVVSSGFPLAVAIGFGAPAVHALAAQDGIQVRVEDGIQVVDLAGLHVADSTAWSIDAVPFVSIGELEGEPPYLFGDVAGVLFLGSGEILVADGQAFELRVFDMDGRYLRTVGREGDGPGEFRGISGLRRLRGDSIAVLAGWPQVVHVFDPSLEFVRRARARLSEQSAEPPLSSDMMLGVFGTAEPFFGDYVAVCRGEQGDGRICSDSVRFSRTDPEGEILARFGTFEWERMRTLNSSSGPSSSMRWPLPQPLWAAGPEALHHFDQDRRELRTFDLDGTLVRRVRIGGEAPDWSRREVFPPRAAGAPDGVPPEILAGLVAARDRLNGMPLPDPFPTFADIFVDRADRIWLREYLPAAPAETRPPRWYVFDLDERRVFRVDAPPGLVRRWSTGRDMLVPDVRDDAVLTVTTDEFGVERVVGYRLVRNR